MAVDARRDHRRACARRRRRRSSRLAPAWVARDFLPPGERLGLADGAVRPRGPRRVLRALARVDHQGRQPRRSRRRRSELSRARRTRPDHARRTRSSADPVAIMGRDYAATHDGLGPPGEDLRLRRPSAVPPAPASGARRARGSALQGRGVLLPAGRRHGSAPGVVPRAPPSVAEDGNHELLLPYLERWDSDLILQHSAAYLQVADEGFHIPSGVLHAPGTALTIELQEDSDVFAMLQALNAGRIISKELLWKDVRAEDREAKGERFILELIDWEANGDPVLLRATTISRRSRSRARGRTAARSLDLLQHHEVQREEARGASRLLVPRASTPGVHNVLVWSGPAAPYGGLAGPGWRPGSWTSCSSRTIEPSRGVEVRNTGREDLLVIKFFGPDVNPDVPMIPRR